MCWCGRLCGVIRASKTLESAISIDWAATLPGATNPKPAKPAHQIHDIVRGIRSLGENPGTGAGLLQEGDGRGCCTGISGQWLDGNCNETDPEFTAGV